MELFLIEGALLGGSLDLDDLPGAGHDEVQVHLGTRVLLIIEVE